MHTIHPWSSKNIWKILNSYKNANKLQTSVNNKFTDQYQANRAINFELHKFIVILFIQISLAGHVKWSNGHHDDIH